MAAVVNHMVLVIITAGEHTTYAIRSRGQPHAREYSYIFVANLRLEPFKPSSPVDGFRLIACAHSFRRGESLARLK